MVLTALLVLSVLQYRAFTTVTVMRVLMLSIFNLVLVQ